MRRELAGASGRGGLLLLVGFGLVEVIDDAPEDGLHGRDVSLGDVKVFVHFVQLGVYSLELLTLV